MEETSKITKTTCPYCGVGCGVLAEVAADGKVSVRGDPDHPANFGKLCSKGSALAETVDLDGRLLHPVVNGRQVSWDRALDLVAATFQRTIAEHGPESVAFYVSGQLLTEDYYVANKLMKGFIGTANIDTNSRLCMASSVAGHRRAFGTDTVPGNYEDLELADLVILTGSNLAWCHPVIYQRIAAAKEKRPSMKVVLIDPRRTMTADIADVHLAIKPDGDTALFAGLLKHLHANGVIDRAYIEHHTTGFQAALEAAAALSNEEIEAQTGLGAAALKEFYALFAATEKTVTVYSQGVNQSSCGTDKVSTIINCHLATGRIGKPGCGPFSITGQPNAMGGREVGGLANMLAAHMDIENAEHRERVQRFWASPHIAERPGLKAVDMFRAVADGRIKALWIMATNPAVSMPEANRVEAALRLCPFVVVSEVSNESDTVRHAHVRLPATAWGEKDGTVTNSERRISRQRPFLPAPGATKPDWWIISEVAKRMGHGAAFNYDSPAAIFAESAKLSAYENGGARDFDIGAYGDVDRAAFDDLEPFMWPQTKQGSATERFFAKGGFFTPDKKARFIPVRAKVETRTTGAFPFVLNTGRVRDHWHTMTRTAKSARLSQHLAEPFVEIHPADADKLKISDADIVRVETAQGTILVRALLSKRPQTGSVFVPMHWTDQFAASARVDTLVPGVTDPYSGQPASKNVAARLERFAASKFGFAVMKNKPSSLGADYWALAKCDGGWRVELAFGADVADWSDYAKQLFGAPETAEMIAYRDMSSDQHRFACFDGDQILGALYLAPSPVAVSRNWAVSQLIAEITGRARLGIIAGRPGKGCVDRGATVCSCFSVGANDIAAAIAKGCVTVKTIGEATNAGTNCGSCRAEIKTILDSRILQAAE